jgi:hypothetical protein
MTFLSRTQIIAAIGAVLLVLYVLDLVRRRKLSEEYSLLWVLSTAVVAALGFSTPLLVWVSRALGIVQENSTVFAFGLAFSLAMLLHLSVRLSRLGQENQMLARELALLRHELEESHFGRAPGVAPVTEPV